MAAGRILPLGVPYRRRVPSSAAARAERPGQPALADTRRHRMLLELAGLQPFEADSWAGQRVRVGEAEIQVVRPVPRCGATQQDPATGRFPLPTLRHRLRQRGPGPDGRSVHLGTYGEVVRPGWMAVGDPVEPGSAGPAGPG